VVWNLGITFLLNCVPIWHPECILKFTNTLDPIYEILIRINPIRNSLLYPEINGVAKDFE